MTRAIPKGRPTKLWAVSVCEFPTSALTPARSEPGSQICGSDHPKNLVLRGTNVGLETSSSLEGRGRRAKETGSPCREKAGPLRILLP